MGKKKLTKKEKARLEAEQAETLRVEMEKERLKKIEEDRERKMRERRDAKKKQEQEAVENKLRRVQLRDSSRVFKTTKEEIKRLLIEEKQNKEWEQYMRCNGLPNSDSPSDLRKYIYMWQDDMKNLNKKEINWLLKTNEQSILTQDQTVQDLSKNSLKNMQTNFGEIYAKRAEEVLGILQEVESVIRDRYNVSITKLEDLLDLKLEFRTVLESFIDEFSFKILGNIDRNMTLSGLVQATYKFSSDVFNTELYALRDIPLPPPANPKDKMKEEKTAIEFTSFRMSLLLPPSIKCHKNAIRGLWLNYDHLSDYCHSYIYKYDDSGKKKLTLRQTTKREWKKRKELLQQALFQIFNEKPDESSEDKENPQPRVIDVDQMYTEYEDQLNSIERAKMGPEALNLNEFEVNLRSHRITGGIFLIEYLEQPLQNIKTDEGALLRTLIHPIKLKKKIFHQPYRPPAPAKPGQRRQPEEVEAEIKIMEENLERLALVTIELPENVSWFEPPIVCRWETDEEFHETNKMELPRDPRQSQDEDDAEEEIKIEDSNKTQKENIVKPALSRKIKVIEDFNLLDIPDKVCLQELFEDFIVQMIPEGYEIKFEQNRLKILNNESDECKKMYTIDDIVYQTKCSKYLFPNCEARKVLKVVKVRSKSIDYFSGQEYSSDTDNDESMYSADSEQQGLKLNIYMFSKFMRDLEDLAELEYPSFDKKVAEISSNLSMTSEVNDTEGLDRQNSKISLSKTNSKSLLDVSSGSDSGADSDTDKEDADEDNLSCTLIDAAVKQANIKRCSGRWSTRDIHDVKFNEDKLTIQFRSGRLGTFGLASNRYSNFPYQSWELKPEFKTPGVVIFTLTASVISMEFFVFADGIILNAIQGCPTTVLTEVVGIKMCLQDLMLHMRAAACDVFPEDDAFCYMENLGEKNYVMESHIYECMCFFALSHNFAWSRWNSAAGSRTAVFLMRELIEHRKLPNQSTIHITPFKACILDCTEVSPTYTPVEMPDIEYSADLYHLAVSTIQPVSKLKMESMNPILHQNMLELLKATRPLSFC